MQTTTSRPRHLTRLKRELPPAAPLPAILQTAGSRQLPLSYIEWCRARYGERFTIYPLDMPPLVFLSSPKDIRAVVSAPAHILHPGAGSAILAPLIGEQAFILAEEDQHLCARSATIPAFHHRVVQDLASDVAKVAAHDIASWPLEVPFATHPYIRSLTLRAVLRSIFTSEPEEAMTKLHAEVLELLSITATFLLQQPRLRHLPGWHATWQRFVGRRTGVEALIFDAIQRRRSHPEGSQGVLAMLLAASNADGSPMSDRQIHDHVMSMIVAGHETTAAEIAWAFQLIAHNPTVQDRLIQEIYAGDDERYLTATIHETMRHRPAFMFAIPRKVATPTEIGGWRYPRGAHLVPCTYLMHHDPALYPEPNTFWPERFLDEAPQAGTYLPWGPGASAASGGTSPSWRCRLSYARLSNTELSTQQARRLSIPAGAARSWYPTPDHA